MSPFLNDSEIPVWRCKIMLIGDTGVGKSSLMLRYADDIFEPGYVTTIGVDFKCRKFEHKYKGKEMQTVVQLWDTAGQERFAPLIKTYYRSSTGCIIVFDLTCRETFENVKTWMSNLLDATCGDLDRSCIFVIGNKCDDKAGREVEEEEAKELTEQFGVQYREVSAKTDVNVTPMFEDIVSAAREIHCSNSFLGIDASKQDINCRIAGQKEDEDSICYCTVQ